MLCVNPLTGLAAAKRRQRRTSAPSSPMRTHRGRTQAPGVPARCDVRGFLLIGSDPPTSAPMCSPATTTTSTITPCSG
jgi:hypothetical protein